CARTLWLLQGGLDYW
nr:immunoglobulin heavy chain junction region [Macaca mulatta]MPN71539.1 immunoglobulin heavy chain junction region [Macaca mulatta]MPN72203.1 immunoglobulin heavy chain junction region [Macaca mulatta]MPN73424.1 immunoglobulin heavy chain junction region [Macaca mulatta]MPN74069.1 immunoglobulin heavy chain junction region [Macaca mulatta]